MTRTLQRLTAIKVRTAKVGMWCDGGNLYLQCTAGADDSVSRSWLFRYAVNGRERQMGLGALETTSLTEAREKAAQCRKQRSLGIDPLEHRRTLRAALALETAKAMTFDQCCDSYLKAHTAGWRSAKHKQQWTNTIKDYASPVFGEVAVQDVNTQLVMKALEAIWTTRPETASRVRGRIESVLDWAKARGFRTGENPARWRGHLDHLLPARSKVRTVKHHPALPFKEMSTFVGDLKRRDGVVASALEFLILTAARSDEIISARWDEIDLTAKVWTVPASRMKGGIMHRVPLSDAAIGVLDRMKSIRTNDYIFPGERRAKMADAMMLKLIREMGYATVVHGFRSTFRDWASETTAFQHEVVEMALAHVINSPVEAAYRRGDLLDKRRHLMTAWAEYCLQGMPLITIA